ncbi:hypothetical protein Trydic_g4618 [Trypoxylus dichotomus]
MLRAVERKTMRTTKGVSLRDQIGCKVITEDLEIQDIVRFTRARRQFRKHLVDKMTEDHWAKWTKDEKLNSRRPPGPRPKKWCESWTTASREAEQH